MVAQIIIVVCTCMYICAWHYYTWYKISNIQFPDTLQIKISVFPTTDSEVLMVKSDTREQVRHSTVQLTLHIFTPYTMHTHTSLHLAPYISRHTSSHHTHLNTDTSPHLGYIHKQHGGLGLATLRLRKRDSEECV